MSKMGRPTLFNQELAERIAERLANGEPLRKICQDEDMPNYMTVLRWQERHPDFGLLSARAKQDGTHALADECLSIADNPTLDPADKRVRIDTRIRLIGKWNAKSYGDRLAVGGSADMDPIKMTTQLDVSNLSLDELDVLAAALQKSLTKDE
jgi:hypothetical protein